MSDYTLSAIASFFNHAVESVTYLADTDAQTDHQELKAHVRSGDYFSLLATKLDEVSQQLVDNKPEQTIALQHLIDDLLYLQKHYNIVQK